MTNTSSIVDSHASKKKFLYLAGVGLLHLVVYYLVNQINVARPHAELLNLHTRVDSWIPYLPWTLVIYYLGWPYPVICAATIIWRLEPEEFLKAIVALGGMIILGGLIQVMLPAKAPWPSDAIQAQQWLHALFYQRPHACLPSMHVAHAVFPTAIGIIALNANYTKILTVVLALAIIISTLTLKEHYFLDAVAGFILGLTFFVYWRYGAWPTREKMQKQSIVTG